MLITKPMLSKLGKQFKSLQEIYKEFGLYRSKKQSSEDMSGLLETIIAENNVDSIPSRGDDNKPDVKLSKSYKTHGEIVEIKCTAGDTWRGGKLSKRPGFYVLVSWQMHPPTFISSEECTLKIFCAGIFLTQDDWDNKEINENTSYYASRYPFKKLLNNNYELYCGNIHQGKRKELICNEI